jgi:hypothetical protein
MSVGSAGSSGILNPSLSTLLAKLGVTKPIAGVADNSDGDTDVSIGPAPTVGSSPYSNALTGATKAALSDQLLALFTKMQQQNGSEATVAPGTTTQSSASTSTSEISTTAGPTSPISLDAATDQSNMGSVNAAQSSTAILTSDSAGNAANIASNGTSTIPSLLDMFQRNVTATGSIADVTA